MKHKKIKFSTFKKLVWLAILAGIIIASVLLYEIFTDIENKLTIVIIIIFLQLFLGLIVIEIFKRGKFSDRLYDKEK